MADATKQDQTRSREEKSSEQSSAQSAKRKAKPGNKGTSLDEPGSGGRGGSAGGNLGRA